MFYSSPSLQFIPSVTSLSHYQHHHHHHSALDNHRGSSHLLPVPPDWLSRSLGPDYRWGVPNIDKEHRY
ncbi:hypothetical protein E2C01_025586 [Portunus trituberculatus]|uniref:Uncharacterized protein n=1 Tax=Portunus trituberculatus TaxID=210409 RepID=A0A5B7EG44_PORTR|nr:hypothetical protein [Portunus trituberculatus]